MFLGFPSVFGVDAPFLPCNSPCLQRAVIELGVASCNFTTYSVGEVGDVGSFEGRLGRETEEVSQLSVWNMGVCPLLLYTPTEKASVSKLPSTDAILYTPTGQETKVFMANLVEYARQRHFLHIKCTTSD